jgi:hypothetical protein
MKPLSSVRGLVRESVRKRIAWNGRQRLIALAAMVLLNACGGGGSAGSAGPSGTNPEPPPPPGGFLSDPELDQRTKAILAETAQRFAAIPDPGPGGVYRATVGPDNQPIATSPSEQELREIDWAHTLVLDATDPEPDWVVTRLTRSLAWMNAGESLDIGINKVNRLEEVYAPVPAQAMALKVRWQRLDGSLVEGAGSATWVRDGLIRVTAPTGLGPGSLLVALRPTGITDRATLALAERWSVTFAANVWATKPGVVDLKTLGELVFTAAGPAVDTLSPADRALATSAAAAAVEWVRKEQEIALPVVLRKAQTPLAVGALVDYRANDGSMPLGGVVRRVWTEGDAQLAIVAPDAKSTYDFPAPPGTAALKSAGLVPAHQIWVVDGTRLAAEAAAKAAAQQRKVVATAGQRVAPLALPDFEFYCKGATFTLEPYMIWGGEWGFRFKLRGADLKCDPKFKWPVTLGPYWEAGLIALVGAEALKPAAFVTGSIGIKTPFVTTAGWNNKDGGFWKFNTEQAPGRLTGTPLKPSAGMSLSAGVEVKRDTKQPLGGVVGLLVQLDKLLGSLLLDELLQFSVSVQGGGTAELELPNAAEVYQKAILKSDSTKNSGFKWDAFIQFGVSTSPVSKKFFDRMKLSFLADMLQLRPKITLGQWNLKFNGLVKSRLVSKDSAVVDRIGIDYPGWFRNALNTLFSTGAGNFTDTPIAGIVAPREGTALSVFDNDVTNSGTIDASKDCEAFPKLKTPLVACQGPFCSATPDVPLCGDLLGTLTDTIGVGQVGGSASAQIAGSVTPTVAVPLTQYGGSGTQLAWQKEGTLIGEAGVQFTSTASGTCPKVGVFNGDNTLNVTEVIQGGNGQTRELVRSSAVKVCRDGPPPPVWGDPHIGLANGQGYDFHGEGDFVILQNADLSAVVHARFGRVAGTSGATATQRLALVVGSDLVEIRPHPVAGALEVRVNGKTFVGSEFSTSRRRYLLPGGGSIFAIERVPGVGNRPSNLLIAWPGKGEEPSLGLEVKVNRTNTTGPHWLDFAPIIDEASEGTFTGLLGSGSRTAPGFSSLLLRSGQPLLADVNAPLTFGDVYARLGADWAVQAYECLFSGGCQAPSMPAIAATLTEEQQLLGQQACSDIPPGFVRDACIFDVGITGDPTIASNYGVISSLPFFSPVPPTTPINLALSKGSIFAGINSTTVTDLRITTSASTAYLVTLTLPPGASLSWDGVAAAGATSIGSGTVMAAGPPAIHMVSLGCGSQTGIGSLAFVPTDPVSGIVTGPIGAVNLRCGTPDPAPDPAPVHVAWSNDNSAALVDAQGRLWTWGYNYNQVLNRSFPQPHGPQGEIPLPPGCQARTACDQISGSGTPGITFHHEKWPWVYNNSKVKQVFAYEHYTKDWDNFGSTSIRPKDPPPVTSPMYNTHVSSYALLLDNGKIVRTFYGYFFNYDLISHPNYKFTNVRPIRLWKPWKGEATMFLAIDSSETLWASSFWRDPEIWKLELPGTSFKRLVGDPERMEWIGAMDSDGRLRYSKDKATLFDRHYASPPPKSVEDLLPLATPPGIQVKQVAGAVYLDSLGVLRTLFDWSASDGTYWSASDGTLYPRLLRDTVITLPGNATAVRIDSVGPLHLVVDSLGKLHMFGYEAIGAPTGMSNPPTTPGGTDLVQPAIATAEFPDGVRVVAAFAGLERTYEKHPTEDTGVTRLGAKVIYAIDTEGRLWAWGSGPNLAPLFGAGATVAKPQLVNALPPVRYTSIMALHGAPRTDVYWRRGQDLRHYAIDEAGRIHRWGGPNAAPVEEFFLEPGKITPLMKQ